MTGRSWMGWTALAAVLSVYGASQNAQLATHLNEARTNLAASLPASLAAYVAPAASANPAAAKGSAPGAGGKPTANAGPPGKRAAPPAPVITDKAKLGTVPLRLEGVGSVMARSTVAIKARIDGQLMEAAVKEGQLVKKGDLLFRIDSRALESQLRVAEANLARDRANLEKAKSDHSRIGDLANKGFSPKAKYDDAKASLGALEATIKADEAAIEAAKLNLDYAVIRAPIAGRTGNVLVHPGNMVKANDTQALIVLTEIAPVYVAFAIPERYLGEVKRLMTAGKVGVDVWTPEAKSEKIKGELFFMNNAVDTSTGTITLMATFPNADQKLMPGQFVQASALLGTLDQVVVVPSRAVQVGQKGTFVYVAKDDLTAEFRLVQVGDSVDGQSVIKSGLAAGETIVVEGQLRILPGGKLAPKDAPPTAKTKEQS
jgi:membrane fusion protein, multidrug efflux system